MKNLIVLLLALGIVGVFVGGCSGDAAAEGETPAAGADTEAAEDTE